MRIIQALWLSAVMFSAYSQSMTLPELFFDKDSFPLGMPIQATMVYKHAPSQEILFPDSSYDFAPFEFLGKKYFNTYTKDSVSVDSVQYTLRTFDMESGLRLSLPVAIFEEGDTSQLFSNDAFISYSPLVQHISPKDSLKVNTSFWALSYDVNYPYALITILVLGIICIIVFLFFRKKIIAQYQLYMAKRDYERFFNDFNKLESQYIAQKTSQVLEQMLILWKKYLEKLEKAPYSTLTTKEISQIMDYNQLSSSLQNFDRAIYGGIVKEDMSGSIGILRETSLKKFTDKTKELRRV
ncbi:MAG: hypothetical protein NW207_08745 [Cytophagales bacterium]|nr:hypothetical protein [Cytophagales bacterium]